MPAHILLHCYYIIEIENVVKFYVQTHAFSHTGSHTNLTQFLPFTYGKVIIKSFLQ